MDNLDVPLSEEVAMQAGKEISGLKQTIETNKDLQNSIMRDFVSDTRIANHFIKKICIILSVLLFIAIGGIIGLSIYSQNLIKKTTDEHNRQMIDFMMNTDFETTVDMTAEEYSSNNGDINVR